jgi:monoamine oxidase
VRKKKKEAVERKSLTLRNQMPGASFARLRQSVGRGIRVSDKLKVMDACLSRQEAELKSILSVTCKKQHVGIVGGGVAGLFAAIILKSVGCRVTLWEATERVGGRVRTLRDFIRGRLIEAGAELIGLNHPLWLLLNRKFGLGLSALTSEEDYAGQGLAMPVRLGGKELSRSEVVELEAQVNLVLMRISADARLVRYPATPWLESPEIQSLDRVSVAHKFDEWKVRGSVREWLTTTFECDNVSELRHQSYLGLLCVCGQGRIARRKHRSVLGHCGGVSLFEGQRQFGHLHCGLPGLLCKTEHSGHSRAVRNQEKPD